MTASTTSPELQLPSGLVMGLRTIGPDDGPAIEAIFNRMSDQSRYQRFCTPTPRLTGTMLRALTDLDGCHRYAVGAVDPNRPSDTGGDGGLDIGLARFARLREDPDEADVAVSVIDDYHGLGIATVLLRTLRAHALDVGVKRFRFDMLATNAAIKATIGRLDVSWSRVPDEPGMVRAVLPLDMPGCA